MTERLLQVTTAPTEASANADLTDNPAVVRCCTAWKQGYEAEFEQTKSNAHAQFAASRAYRDAMPTLGGYDNIRDFVACTAHGILLGAIDGTKSTKLLYAAQVALTIIRRQSPPQETHPA